ncbi:tRNA pseudouridine synthase A [Holophaga foetida]|uniref:tRNA pseudouridine synthase A n=1 Tax=Holophaga foetida TaxID=35839 RepID=UPI0002473AC9|nr:tRNA pseudouridine synthase A [Holophaga foetida]
MKPTGKPKPGKGPERTAYRILLEYDGSRYQGWQKQGEKQSAQGVRTVAGTLERVLHQGGLRVLNLTGSGRTDGGVHAAGQVAHLHLAAPAPRPAELRRIFDEGLPADIAIREIVPCPASFHARHDATFRTYVYQIALRRSAFAKPYVWWVKAPLSLDKLQQAWSSFEGVHDFSAYADLEPGESPKGHVRSCQCAREGDLILLRITAGHFLRRQVRRMVGAAVQCALGREKLEQLRQDLEQPGPEATLYWSEKAAPSSGLFLERVGYAGDEMEPEARSVVAVR